MKTTLLALLCILILATPQLAAAQIQGFDFLGQTDLPDVVGGDLSMYSLVRDGSPSLIPPFAMDFDNYEYTLVVTGLTLVSDGGQQGYANGSIALYEDNGSAADYGNLATFTDGTAILTGVITTLTRTVTALPFPPFTAVSINGTVDWNGGTRLDDFAPADQLNWSFLAGGNTDPSSILTGFDEQWDGKVEPKEFVVGSEAQSLGELKATFGR